MVTLPACEKGSDGSNARFLKLKSLVAILPQPPRLRLWQIMERMA